MAPPGFKVIIAGGGIAGLSFAIMLERQNVDYLILERCTTFKVLGSGISLSPQVLRVFDQMGMLDELNAISKPLTGMDYLDQRLRKVGHINTSGFEKRYGYPCVFFARSTLMETLLKHISAEKILWGKRILSTMQNANGAMVRVADGSTYHGDIIVGADGAYSAVRQSLYKNMAMKGLEVSKSDTGPLRFQQFGILGITKPLGHKYPVLNEPTSKVEVILASKDISHNVYAIPMPEGCLAWAVSGNYLNAEVHDQENFRFSEWGSESIEAVRRKVENIKISIGGTVGEVMAASENISKVMLEDKVFQTWFEGRTVLIGDAAHKLMPAGGQGGNQSILDAICLANLLYELSSSSLEDINTVFRKYYEIRSPTAKKAIEVSTQLNKLMVNQGRMADLMRSVALNLPDSFINMAQDAQFGGRPTLNYLEPIPLKGVCKDRSPPHTLGLKKNDTVTI